MKLTLKTVLGFVAVIIAAMSTLLIVVDGVAIIFTYASLVFALFSIGAGNKNILKVYGVVFIISNLVFGWRVYDDSNSSNRQYSEVPPDFKNFEMCSNKMFEDVEAKQAALTPEKKAEFERCINN